jgi:acetyltransferase EpsM
MDIKVIGHGQFFTEVHTTILEMLDINILQYFDDNVLTDLPVLSVLDSDIETDTYMICIGYSKIRKAVFTRSMLSFERFSNFIHPSVDVSNVSLQGGVIICPGTVFTSNVSIGNMVVIHINCSIGHDVGLGDFVSLMPGVNIGGNVSVGEGTFIGIGATIINGITIGKWCTIGAGSVIISDVPDNATVVGNPGRIVQK